MTSQGSEIPLTSINKHNHIQTMIMLRKKNIFKITKQHHTCMRWIRYFWRYRSANFIWLATKCTTNSESV